MTAAPEPLRRVVQNDLAIAAIIALAIAGYYFIPSIPLAVACTALFAVAAWLRLDVALLSVLVTAPFFRFPRVFDPGALAQSLGRATPVEISLAEYCIWVCAAAWLARRVTGRPACGAVPTRDARSGRDLWWPAALLVGVAVISLPPAAHSEVALREFRTVVLEPSLYYLLLVSTLRGLSDVLRSLLAAVLLGGAVGIYSLYHYWVIGVVENTGGVARILAVYHSPNALALFLGRIIPMSAALAVAVGTRGPEDRRARGARGAALPAILSVLSLFLMGLAFYFTYSRGAIIGVAAALVFLGLIVNRKVTLLALGVAVALGLAALPFLPLDRLLQATPLAERLLVWQAAVAMGRDHPLFGVGLDNFLYYYPQYMRPQAALEPDISHPHNLFLDFWLRLGILGVASLAALQWHFWSTALQTLRRCRTVSERALVLAPMASMLDFLVHGLIDNSYFLIDLAFLFWFAYGLVIVLHRSLPIPAGPAAATG